MNKKQYLITIIAIVIVDVAALVLTILGYIDWLWLVVVTSIGYLFIKYKVHGPLQVFSTKFNMMVDYDLEVHDAVKLCEERVAEAPTASIKNLYMVYLGMANYYAGQYEESIKTFNQIELKKLNNIYHVLILSFTAYAAYESDDMETFNLSIERIKNLQSSINRKYLGFVGSYIQVLEAMRDLEDNPEHYKEVIESQFSKNDGYISTKLTYNYRMAQYYRVTGNELEMDICLAKVIANGKEHHTAIQAQKMFKNNVKIEDYIFVEGEEAEDVEVVEDQQLIGTEETDVENIEEVEVVEEKEEDLFK
ncbi:MAG: hypothetical protein RBR66_02595 [Candidatus Izemoplasmatales bacterium]|jgi:tetratricopeptide (TPR) repeat protein|nr:hypothetical protein [Candidatus Izemoplasmatales bacterium]